MQADFTFRVDPARRLVRITIGGFFDEAAVVRYKIARDQAHASLGGSPGEHLTLVDLRSMNVQSQTVVSRFAALLGEGGAQSRRIAFLVDSALKGIQLKRALAGRDAGIFEDEGEATRWLLAPD